MSTTDVRHCPDKHRSSLGIRKEVRELCFGLLLVVRKRIGIIIGMCLTAVSYVLPVELAGIDSHFHVPVFPASPSAPRHRLWLPDIEALLLGNSSLVAHRGYVQYHGGVRTGQIVISYRAIHADIELNNFSRDDSE